MPLTPPTPTLLLTPAPFIETNQALFTPPSPPPSPRVSLDDVLKEFDIPDGAAADTLAFISRRLRESKLNAGSKSKHLMRMERFRDWLAAPPRDSDLIMVDGHCGGTVAADRVSPMSAICAALVEELQRADEDTSPARPAVVVLHHFCSQHRRDRDLLRGPAGLIRNLIQQLLQQLLQQSPWQVGLGFVDGELLRGIGEHDIHSLCRLFCNVTIRLDPSQPVFCVIDGISEIETVLDGWQEDTCSIIEMLRGLVGDTSRAGPALRVLLTSSGRSTVLAETVVPSDGHVSLLAARSPARQSSLLPFQREVDELLMVGYLEVQLEGTDMGTETLHAD